MRTDTERQTDERRDEANSQFFFFSTILRTPPSTTYRREIQGDRQTDNVQGHSHVYTYTVGFNLCALLTRNVLAVRIINNIADYCFLRMQTTVSSRIYAVDSSNLYIHTYIHIRDLFEANIWNFVCWSQTRDKIFKHQFQGIKCPEFNSMRDSKVPQIPA